MKKLIAHTGSQGTGKSYATYNKVLEMKRRYPERSVYALADIEAFRRRELNERMTEESQALLFAKKIEMDLEAMAAHDIIVTDRTLVDIVAYTFVAGFHSLATGMLPYAEYHVQYYDEIIFKKIEFNPHWHNDGIREHKDKQFRQNVEDTLLSLYKQLLDPSVFPGAVYYV